MSPPLNWLDICTIFDIILLGNDVSLRLLA